MDQNIAEDKELNRRAANARVPWVEVMLLTVGSANMMIWKKQGDVYYLVLAGVVVLIYCVFHWQLMCCVRGMSREEKRARIEHFDQKYGA